jgi:cytoskeletal protein CcmA (bactofilin family)
MKSKLNKRLAILLVLAAIFALAACSTLPASQAGGESFSDTYPSQFLSGDVYILKANERIDGNISGVGTTLIIQEGALVTGDISLIGGNLDVEGKINGNVNVLAGTAKIGDTAHINGNLNQIFNQTDISPQAMIDGQINTFVIPLSGEQNFGKNVTNLLEWLKPAVWLLLQFIRIVGLIVFTLIATALFKQPTFNVIHAVRKSPAVAWGAGLLTIFSLPIISTVLIVTVCLSPIGLILLIALLICVIWSWTVISNMVGTQMTRWLHLEWSAEGTAVFGALLVGILISTISLLPVAGFLINLFFCSVGLGGILLSRFGTLPS